MDETPAKLTTKQEHPFWLVYRELSDLADNLPKRSHVQKLSTYWLGRLNLACLFDPAVTDDPHDSTAKAVVHRIVAAREESKGYVPPEEKGRRRQTPDVRQWRHKVLSRDGFRCVSCGATDNLQAHHIRHWSLVPELRNDVDNGETLCVDCHAERHPSVARLMRSRVSRQTAEVV